MSFISEKDFDNLLAKNNYIPSCNTEEENKEKKEVYDNVCSNVKEQIVEAIRHSIINADNRNSNVLDMIEIESIKQHLKIFPTTTKKK